VNCAALALAPSYIVYSSSKLSEFRVLFLCLWAGVAYVATQALKMIVLATFVPTSPAETFDLIREIIVKLPLSALDIAGIYLVLQTAGGHSGEIRILAVGVGWASAETVVVRIVPFWVGQARNLEFDWTYLLSAVEANLNLLLYTAFVAVVWVWSRKRLPKSFLPSVVAALFGFSLLPILSSYVSTVVDAQWVALLIYSAVVLILSGVSYILFTAFHAV